MSRVRFWLLLVVVGVFVGAGCGGSDGDIGGSPGTTVANAVTSAPADSDDDSQGESVPTTVAAGPLTGDFAAYSSEVFSDEAHWLCLPGRDDDACAANLDATSVTADGTLTVLPHVPSENPPIDCFYVYPTISGDPTLNSDLIPNDPEKGVVQAQAARLSTTCRVFAPVYRQRTLSGLFGTAEPNPPGVPKDIAYMDVLDSFKDYVANRSEGRGFVLIGHSQGAGMLQRLFQEEIEDVPALRNRVVSAILAGSSVVVPSADAIVGGDFKDMPLCQEVGQIGCVISFASFRSTEPPPPNSRFGRPRSGEGVNACVNPAALAGGPAELTPYFTKLALAGLTDPEAAERVTTPFVTAPGLLTGECVYENGFSYLKVTVNSDPADPRSDEITGDVAPGWGLHLVDLNLVMGDVQKVVAAQAETYIG